MSTLLRAAALVAMSAVAAACGGGGEMPAGTNGPTIPFEKVTLDNGLEVIFSQNDSLPIVSVNVWYHVGPANEAAGRTGFAHLFEHMMFQGSKHVPADQHFQILDSNGASQVNGTTGYDRTNYFETVPSNQLELALWLEADRMGYLLEVVDQTALSNQQDVVRNERRQRVENTPYGAAEEALSHALFPDGHPYYADIIGSHADIQAAQLEEVRDFFEQYYGPNNATVAIVGDFDRDEALALVQKYFGTLVSGPEPPPADAATPPITAERRETVAVRAELPQLYMAWLSPSFYAPGDAEADVAATILGGGRASRLYEALVYEQQIAQDVSVFQQSAGLASMFRLQATARPGVELADLEAAVQEVLDEFLAAPPTQEEVDHALNGIETDFLIAGLETVGGVANMLNNYNHYLGDPGYLDDDIARYRAVTPEAVQAFATEYLQSSARVVIEAVPGEPEPFDDPPAVAVDVDPDAASPDGINVAEDWRYEQPEGGPVPTFSVPTPASAELANGLTLIVSEERNVPMVSMQLVIGTGSDANPLDRPGLANLAAGMLDEGTATRGALEIADAVAALGGRLTTGSSMDETVITARSLSSNFPALLDLVADVALNPSFPDEELERQRAQRSAQLLQQRSNPEALAVEVLFNSIYGPDHPYGYIELGTPASVAALTRDDLVGFWERNFVPSNAALVVAGDISLDEMRPLAEAAFGAWDGEAAPRIELAAPADPEPGVVIADVPGAAQTVLYVGKVGVARSTADYAPLQVMNDALGGSFSSRINMNLREERGYTYGASSGFTYRKGPGPFFVYSPVRTDVTGQAVEEMFLELREALTSPIAGDELQRSKDSIVLSLPGGFETSAGLAGRFADAWVYGLGLDYYEGFAARIDAVDDAAVAEVTERYITPDRMVVAAAGDRAAIEVPLAALGLGTVRIYQGN
jgi:zinc protease